MNPPPSALRPRVALAVVAAAVAGGLVAVAPARAELQRPSEDDLFGASAPAGAGGAGGAGGAQAAATPAAATPAPPPAVPSGEASAPAPSPASPPSTSPTGAGTGASQATERDVSLLGDPNAGPRLSDKTAPDDPLKIGGQVYLRALAQATSGQAAQNVRASVPSLVDAYFDARPNDRVRGFVLGRLFFDPTLPTAMAATSSSSMSAAGVASAASVPLLSGVQNTRGPNAILDQMWLRFDIKQTVFVTAGRQHVRWGTGRFWTPTDFLHPQRRNPVAAFDARPGFTMLKLDVPYEALGWNFYGFGLVEGTPQLDPVSGTYPAGRDGSGTLGQLGTAGRAELVLGTAELGLDTVLYRGHKPKYGADLSFGIGDFDLYADAALLYGSEFPRRGPDPEDLTPIYDIGRKPQVVLGGTYQLKYNDNDVFTMTGEYFYNSLGYDDPHVYPGLFLTNTFQFFYTGRHYAALGAILAAPYSWDNTTFSFTTLGNLSDQSFISRLDYSFILLTHLRFEAFTAVNYGHREGEFRLGVNELRIGNTTFSQAPQAYSFGLGLRVAL